MREIRFRGKHKDGGWEHGCLSVGREGYEIVSTDGMGLFFHCPVDPSTVGQYTGLKDKNGKEIYEGDVVAQPDDYGTFCHQLVVYAEGRFIPLVRAEYGHNAIDRYDPSAFEVIGNIHDNPELLEGGEKA